MLAKARQTYYYFGSIVTGVVGILLLFNGVKAGTAENVTEILAGLGTLLGAGAPALAGRKVGEQLKNGVFEHLDASAKFSQGVKEFQQQAAVVRSQAEAIKSVLSDAVDDVPVLGPLAADALSKIRF